MKLREGSLTALYLRQDLEVAAGGERPPEAPLDHVRAAEAEAEVLLDQAQGGAQPQPPRQLASASGFRDCLPRWLQQPGLVSTFTAL